MSISAIQEAQKQYEIFPAQRLSTYAEESASGLGAGADKVTISAEAQAMLDKFAATEADGEASAEGDAAQNPAEQAARSLPEIDKGKLLSMMMDMLFISEQGERGQDGGTQFDAEGNPVPAETSAQPKSANPFQDNAQTANLKKVMNDFMSGKADISDLPAAMAGGGSGVAASSKAGKAADTQATPGKAEERISFI